MQNNTKIQSFIVFWNRQDVYFKGKISKLVDFRAELGGEGLYEKSSEQNALQ